MILERYYLSCLAHASYLVADERSRVAAVVDPQRDVDVYVEDAARLGLTIEHVFLTHLHADFVAGHPEAPPYFAFDAMLNAQERPTLEEALERELRPLTLEQVLALRREGAQLLDAREPAEFRRTDLAGAVNVGLDGSYASWCGTVLDPARAVVVVAPSGREREAALRLGRIGFDVVAGFLDGGMLALDGRDELLGRVDALSAAGLARLLAAPRPPLLVDVRTEREWRERSIMGSVNVPLPRLARQVPSLPRDRPLVVSCAIGYRSAIAASLLLREGFEPVADLAGGLAAWTSSDLATVAA